MKNIVPSLISFTAVATLTGCAAGAGAGSWHTPGFLYNETHVPATHLAANTHGEVVTKTGSAMCKSILGLVATGDCSVEAAKENGNIASINNVEYHVKNLLGIYAEYTTKVYGK